MIPLPRSRVAVADPVSPSPSPIFCLSARFQVVYFDVLECTNCHSRMQPMAVITRQDDERVALKFLLPDANPELLSLERCFAARTVIAPWQAGLSPADFQDSFEMDMGYVDAFRLWMMSSIRRSAANWSIYAKYVND